MAGIAADLRRCQTTAAAEVFTHESFFHVTTRVRKTSLQVVTEKTPQARRQPATVKAAADSGTRRELLVALRSRIATDIDGPNTPSRDLAALSRRLLEIVKEIEAIDAEAGTDSISEAAATPDEQWTAT
jgi:hypothetical protein